jgi:hypothetical protein
MMPRLEVKVGIDFVLLHAKSCLKRRLAGFTGTAASSPVTAPLDPGSPDAEGKRSPSPAMSVLDLEGVAIPIYIPIHKPVPAQPAPKIPTGFANAQPLDKTGKKVRHWRVAQREIKMISGGRWFAKSWVGEPESEYGTALAVAKGEAGSAAVKAAMATSISAPVGGKGTGKKSKAASLAASAAPSRSASSVPDALPATTRAPTKMRNMIGPPSEGGDSDIVSVSVLPS